MCSKDCRGVRSHCGKHRFGVAPGGARALLLVLAVGLGLWWAPGAQAAVCQASGSIPLSPVPSTGLQVGDSIAIGVTITNTSSTTPLPGTAASAELRAFGTVRLRLACQDDNCLTPNPGVLTFVNCTGLAAGVDGCIPDPADPTNTVLINIGSAGVTLAAGATTVAVATINATVAATADACAGDASFQFTQGFTGGIRPDCGTTPGCSGTFTQTVRTTDANCTPQASGSATGSTSYQVPLVCEGTFCDPQVCDTDDQSATFGQCIADTPPSCPSTGTCNAGFCNPATDACDVQPANPGTECRPSADGGVCDPPELCTGTSTDCPPNVFRPSSVECRASADGGVCDPPESCTGTSAGCPADVFRPSSVECRASADGGVCDPPEFCTGTSAGCPADVFRPSSVVCRPSSDGGVCDPPESCTGTSAGCPADVFRPSSVVCRASADGGVCDPPESCTGTSGGCPAGVFRPSSVVCRPSSDGGVCDPPENCTGTGPGCPPDVFRPVNTPCTDDGDICTTDVCDGNGACTHIPNDQCGIEVCRTPGFWQERAGTEKGGANLTLLAIEKGGGCLEICGEIITNTAVNSANSAEEALCIRKNGRTLKQLVRQLTAAALNCIVTNGAADCTGVSIEQTFKDCNAACAQGEGTTDDGLDCERAMDCFNSGGTFGDGSCTIPANNCHDATEVGFCHGGPDDGKLCSTVEECADGAECKPGPASSPEKCNQARQNACSVVPFAGPISESQCGSGLKCSTPEVCGQVS